jgi:hypothetical protein
MLTFLSLISNHDFDGLTCGLKLTLAGNYNELLVSEVYNVLFDLKWFMTLAGHYTELPASEVYNVWFDL